MIEKPPVIIFGKPNVRKDEAEALFTIGRCLAILESRWTAVEKPGVIAEILRGYRQEQSTSKTADNFMPLAEGSGLPLHDRVMVITDRTFQTKLDSVIPDWRERNWQIVNNPREIKQTARVMTELVREAGRTLSDGGIQSD